jgi:hypothetical protein
VPTAQLIIFPFAHFPWGTSWALLMVLSLFHPLMCDKSESESESEVEQEMTREK